MCFPEKGTSQLSCYARISAHLSDKYEAYSIRSDFVDFVPVDILQLSSSLSNSARHLAAVASPPLLSLSRPVVHAI